MADKKTSQAQMRASMKWNAANYKRVPLDINKDYYADTLKPAADAAGESVNGYIKEAIRRRIESGT